MLGQSPDACDDPVEGGSATPVRALGVQIGRTIDTHPYGHVIFGEQVAPGVVDQRRIGLEAVVDIVGASERIEGLEQCAELAYPDRQGFPAMPDNLCVLVAFFSWGICRESRRDG